VEHQGEAPEPTTTNRILSARSRIIVPLPLNHVMWKRHVQFYINTHPAAAQLLDDAVVRDGGAELRAAMLGMLGGEVNERARQPSVKKNLPSFTVVHPTSLNRD
jgi:hypothetical protein